MFEAFYTKLLDALIDPIIQFILKIHWALRVFIVLLLACVSLNLTNPAFFSEVLCYGESAIKYSLTTNTSTVYLSDNTKDILESTVSRLKLALQRDIKAQENKAQEYSPWSIAQMYLALANKNTVDAQAVQSINKVVNTECSCWKEGENQPNRKYPRHIPATAWALFTLAYNAYRPTDAQVSFVLDSQQQEEGWWPIYQTGDKQYSSTYATAWSILALDKMLKTNLLSQELDAKARNAIANG